MKKTILLIIAVISLGLITTSFMLLSSVNDLKSQLSQSENMAKSAQEESKRLQVEKEKLSKDNVKLKVDALSFIELNSKLQEEKDSAQKSQQELKKVIKAREALLKTIKKKLAELEKKVEENKNEISLQGKLHKESDYLKNKMIALEGILNKERALYHYNLGVAYSQAKFYNEAINEYEKSLQYSPTNADAHYNLGLLYENIKDVPERAIGHYRMYLELKPDTVDKEEVGGWVKKLEAIIHAKFQDK